MNEQKTNDLPNPPRFAKMVGPSIVLLGLGLGTGEILLWPYMSSKFGLGIIWAAVVGITMQYFINMEIARYTVVKGESVFVGFSRLTRYLPYWFIFSTFIGWFWPGIIATSAKIFTSGFEFGNFEYFAIIFLLVIGVVLTVGKSVYSTVEWFQKVLICIGIPSLLIITIIIAEPGDYVALLRGMVGIGDGFRFIPINSSDFSLFVFLGALAYAGAGGNLNLAQSFYIKEKGYGMCKGKTGVSSAIMKLKEIDIEGQGFDFTEKNFSIFKKWWRMISLEHLLVFLLTGAITIVLLATLAFSTSRYFAAPNPGGISFLINEAKAIGWAINPAVGKYFIVIVTLMLFGTQLTILDSTSRIIAENIVLINRKINIARAYYITVWSQIAFGITVFMIGFSDPVLLVVTGAVINAMAMFVHIGLTQYLNKKLLNKTVSTPLIRRIILFACWLVFGVLGIWAIIDGIAKL